MKSRLFALLTLPLLVGWGPILIFAGGELEGVISPVPADWSALDNVKTVQLETRPDDPYSVNIWVIGIGTKLYVHAGANRATWVENIEANPNVRIAVDERLYELRASRVQSKEEFAQFSDAYEAKYDRRPRNENVSEAYLFRLETGS